MKKRWLFVALILGALAIVIGVTAGTVLAQSGGSSTTTPFQSFAARVASILGIDQTKVQDAMTQAASEMQNDALKQRLDKMVANGRMTQDQEDQILKWYESRPQGISPNLPFGGPGFFGGRMRGGHGWGGGMGFKWGVPPQSTPTPAPSTN